MMPPDEKTSDSSVDVFGLKPFAKSVEIVSQGVVDGAAAFLSRICLPAADELGLFLRDRVCDFRSQHAAKIVDEARKMVEDRAEQAEVYASPRIVAGVLELGSWSSAEEIHHFWAGLLASACTEDGRDEGNLMFLDVLSKLTVSQARIFDHICQHSSKVMVPAGWIAADEVSLSIEELLKISGLKDFLQLDLELDHLRFVGILPTPGGGFSEDGTVARVTPTAFALRMYMRCQGYVGDPFSFYGVDSSNPRAAKRTGIPITFTSADEL